MNTYTEDDIKTLVDMSPKNSAISFTLKRKEYNTEFFHNMLWAYSRKEWSFVFEVPFEDIPLYINGAPASKFFPNIEGFLKWRLAIKK